MNARRSAHENIKRTDATRKSETRAGPGTAERDIKSAALKRKRKLFACVCCGAHPLVGRASKQAKVSLDQRVGLLTSQELVNLQYFALSLSPFALDHHRAREAAIMSLDEGANVGQMEEMARKRKERLQALKRKAQPGDDGHGAKHVDTSLPK